jgi:hypothetical protein
MIPAKMNAKAKLAKGVILFSAFFPRMRKTTTATTARTAMEIKAKATDAVMSAPFV